MLVHFFSVSPEHSVLVITVPLQQRLPGLFSNIDQSQSCVKQEMLQIKM